VPYHEARRTPATLIDPHGDLTKLIMSMLVERGYLLAKVIYLDLPEAERRNMYLPFNVLGRHGTPHAVASQVLEAFHRAWSSLAGGVAPSFDLLVLNGVEALASNNLPLPMLYHFLTDKDFRDEVLANEPDRDVVSVFHQWFDHLPPKEQLEQSGSTVRRVNLLTFNPVLKYSLGQVENALDFRSLMDEGKSLIVNLALGDTTARLLIGCLLAVAAEQAALSRADRPSGERGPPHHLVIDEFSEFTAQSEEALSRMLSMTRKYGLYLTMAHQT